MLRLTKGLYTTDTSDIIIDIIKVGYQNDKYAKIKVNLINKHNDIVYEQRRNYKVWKHRITHWKQYNKWEKNETVS